MPYVVEAQPILDPLKIVVAIERMNNASIFENETHVRLRSTEYPAAAGGNLKPGAPRRHRNYEFGRLRAVAQVNRPHPGLASRSRGMRNKRWRQLGLEVEQRW